MGPHSHTRILCKVLHAEGPCVWISLGWCASTAESREMRPLAKADVERCIMAWRAERMAMDIEDKVLEQELFPPQVANASNCFSDPLSLRTGAAMVKVLGAARKSLAVRGEFHACKRVPCR
jgi:MoxR-like ATPase